MSEETMDEPTVGSPWIVPDLSLDMLWCKPGAFQMGSPEDEEDRQDNETLHEVTLTSGYWLGKHPVTQAQWEKVMGDNPSHFKGADRPVENVSWDEVTSFCEKLTELEREAGRLPAGMSYQLPTEAQWEYACRAGTTTAYAFGDELTEKDANFEKFTMSDETTDVGKYPANEWGFHDMHGNVWEWCADLYEDDYPTGNVTNPTGSADGSPRVLRGGSWFITANYARSASRSWYVPAFSDDYLGFRLSLRPPASKAEPLVQVQEQESVAVSVNAGTAITIRDLGLDKGGWGLRLPSELSILEKLKAKGSGGLAGLEDLVRRNREDPEELDCLLRGLMGGDFLEKADLAQTASILQDATAGMVSAYCDDEDRQDTALGLSLSLFSRLAARVTTARECLGLARNTTYEFCHLEDFACRMVDKAVELAVEEGVDADLLAYFWETCWDEYFRYTEAIDDLAGSLEEFRLADFADGADSWPAEFSSMEWSDKPMPKLKSFRNLRKLDLSGQCFGELPAELGELEKLEELDLGDNPVEILPVEIAKLKNLKTLDLAGCESLENVDAIKDLKIEDLRLPEHLK